MRRTSERSIKQTLDWLAFFVAFCCVFGAFKYFYFSERYENMWTCGDDDGDD